MKHSSLKMMLTGLIIILGLNGSAFGQFQVEFNEINGTLSKSDEFKKDFGRYDGYQIPLYKGEGVNFVVYSEKFMPRLVFVSPAGKVFKQSNEHESVATIITSVPDGGEWVLYVVGDSTAHGEYSFQYALAAANSLKLPKDSDFCTTLNFIIAHAKAYFLLFENPIDYKQAFVKLNGAEDAFIDDADGSYTSKMYEGDDLSEAEKKFNELSSEIGKCLGNNWERVSQSWTPMDDYKVKTVLFTEKVKNKQRFVALGLQDLRNSRQKFTGNYVLQIVINRKN